MDYKEKIIALLNDKELSQEQKEKLEYIFPELKESEDDRKSNGGIVFEDFNEGDGFYKVNLAYLSKEQVEEIENIVKKWNPELKESEDEKIRKELICFLETEIPQCNARDKYIAWLEKQKEFVSADFEDVWETADCEELTAPLDKYSKDAIKEMCHAWYDKGIELERRNWLEKQGQTFTKKDVDDAYLKGISDAKNELEKQGEQKPWSDEDEENLQHCCMAISVDSLHTYEDKQEMEAWLKSLKNRIGG